MSLSARLPKSDLASTPLGGVFAALLLSCAACGGEAEVSSRSSGTARGATQEQVSDICLDIEAAVENLMGFIGGTDDLELLLHTAREPAAADATLSGQDAADKYLSIKTWMTSAEVLAPEAFKSRVAWGAVADASGAAKLAHAREKLAALDVETLSRTVGTRRAYIAKHLGDVDRCLAQMKADERATDKPTK